jgi:multidrug efflux pump subunit AcrA (membrane-fusion protein)
MNRFKTLRTIAVLTCVLAAIITVGTLWWRDRQRVQEMKERWAKTEEDARLEKEHRRKAELDRAAEFAGKQQQLEKDEKERRAAEDARRRADEERQRRADEAKRKLAALIAEGRYRAHSALMLTLPRWSRTPERGLFLAAGRSVQPASPGRR